MATPLPPQFGPLLDETVERVKTVIARVMPVEKKLTALEEAMFEDDDGEEGALEKEMLMQCSWTNLKKLLSLTNEQLCRHFVFTDQELSCTVQSAWAKDTSALLRCITLKVIISRA